MEHYNLNHSHQLFFLLIPVMNLIFFSFCTDVMSRILCHREQRTNRSSEFLHFPLVFVPINHNPTRKFEIFVFWFPWSTLNCTYYTYYPTIQSETIKKVYHLAFFYTFCLAVPILITFLTILLGGGDTRQGNGPTLI